VSEVAVHLEEWGIRKKSIDIWKRLFIYRERDFRLWRRCSCWFRSSGMFRPFD